MSEIKPALTEEEWAKGFNNEGEPVFNFDHDDTVVTLRGEDRHRFAAACLHDQPFGFTHEHVRHLRDMSSAEYGYKYLQTQEIADLIEALLPPKT